MLYLILSNRHMRCPGSFLVHETYDCVLNKNSTCRGGYQQLAEPDNRTIPSLGLSSRMYLPKFRRVKWTHCCPCSFSTMCPSNIGKYGFALQRATGTLPSTASFCLAIQRAWYSWKSKPILREPWLGFVRTRHCAWGRRHMQVNSRPYLI